MCLASNIAMLELGTVPKDTEHWHWTYDISQHIDATIRLKGEVATAAASKWRSCEQRHSICSCNVLYSLCARKLQTASNLKHRLGVTPPPATLGASLAHHLQEHSSSTAWFLKPTGRSNVSYKMLLCKLYFLTPCQQLLMNYWVQYKH